MKREELDDVGLFIFDNPLQWFITFLEFEQTISPLASATVRSPKMKSSSWGFFFIKRAFRPIDLQKGGRRSMRIQIFVNGFCWNDVLKKPPFLFCLIPSTLFVQNMYNIDFWHNWCLFAPFIQDCHCCLLYGLLWWNYTRWKEIPDGYFSIIINCFLHAQLVAK